MFEIVERKVTKTEVEKVAVFTCEMCGKKINAVSNSNENGSCFSLGPEWVQVLNKDICPSCSERVREFIEGKLITTSISDRYKVRVFPEICDQLIDLDTRCKALALDSEKLEKERDELKERVEELGKERSECISACQKTVSSPTTYAEACAGLQPFDKVLVRDEIGCTWRARNFELMHEAFVKIFLCTDGEDYRFCLPYEPYKHLLGTTNIPWEEEWKS